MDEVKFCPFCGGKSLLWEDEYDGTKIYGVSCEKCGITTAAYENEQQAIDNWNKRIK